MKILFLGPEKEPQTTLINFLQNDGNLVIKREEKLYIKDIDKCEYDWLISFGFRYIIDKKILDSFKKRAINLHVSYLPWNRGADPNLWSIYENTPKGVTIHQIDSGVDTG